MNNIAQNKKITAAGIVLTIFATAVFLWAANQWFNRYNWPPPLTTEELRSNGIHTFENLRLIAQAQEQYKKTDWDKNGEKTYAVYFTHLWTTVDDNNDPLLIELISKDLAFAFGPYRPEDGYFFSSFYARAAENGQPKNLDYKNEWALLAVPAIYTKKGAPIFIVDNSGRIFTQKYNVMVYIYPNNPVEEGWTEIKDLQQLKEFQATVSYSTEMTTYPYRYK